MPRTPKAAAMLEILGWREGGGRGEGGGGGRDTTPERGVGDKIATKRGQR